MLHRTFKLSGPVEDQSGQIGIKERQSQRITTEETVGNIADVQ